MFAIEFYHLGCDVILSFTKQDYWPTSSYLNYFDELYFYRPSRRGGGMVRNCMLKKIHSLKIMQKSNNKI